MKSTWNWPCAVQLTLLWLQFRFHCVEYCSVLVLTLIEVLHEHKAAIRPSENTHSLAIVTYCFARGSTSWTAQAWRFMVTHPAGADPYKHEKQVIHLLMPSSHLDCALHTWLTRGMHGTCSYVLSFDAQPGRDACTCNYSANSEWRMASLPVGARGSVWTYTDSAMCSSLCQLNALST